MAVVSARKLWHDRDGDAERAGTRRYTESWRVETDTKTDGVVTVGAGFTFFTGVGYGSTYFEDSGAWLQRIAPRNESFSPYVWIVTCNYSSERETAADPTAEPAQITWSGEQFQRPAVLDINGDAIVNSAGDWFDDSPQMDDSRVTCQIQKNVVAVPSWILDYRDAINIAPFTVDGVYVGAGLAKCQPPQIGPEQERNSIVFRQLSLTLQFRDEGWQLYILDRGYNEIDPFDSGERIKILDSKGLEPSSPSLLNGAGEYMPDPGPSNFYNLTFDVYKQRDFSVLPGIT